MGITEESISVMIVDDELTISRSLSAFFKDVGFNAQAFNSGGEALEALKTQGFDVAIVDLNMPSMDGIEFITRAKTIRPQLGFVVYAGEILSPQVAELKNLGIDPKYLLQKPLTNLGEILGIIKEVAKHE